MGESYDVILIGNVSMYERNQSLKECFQKTLRTYYYGPKSLDILVCALAESNIVDSPILLSRNDGLQIEQHIRKKDIGYTIFYDWFHRI